MDGLESIDKLQDICFAFNAENVFHPFIAKNSSILSLIEDIKKTSTIDSSILILGESGVGKGILAEQAHLLSNRKEKPFIRIRCDSLSPNLLDSKLFGDTSNKGIIEKAFGGTLFFDEISFLPLSLQAKLLRMIQEKRIEKIDSSEKVSVDVRLIVSTRYDLEGMVKKETFLSDLYFSLNVLQLTVPPLRERKDEIEELCNFFLLKHKSEVHKDFEGFSEVAKKTIQTYMWPGNIRELSNAIERACIVGCPPLIQNSDLRLPNDLDILQKEEEIKNIAEESFSKNDKTLKTALKAFKRNYVSLILQSENWNQTAASKTLDIQRTYLSKLISDLDLRR